MALLGESFSKCAVQPERNFKDKDKLELYFKDPARTAQ
jgi:hypothetical protein